MAERCVIVEAPCRSGGRCVHVDDEILGTAYSLHDLTVLLQHAGVVRGGELDVAETEVIEWYGGGPEVWPRQGGGPDCWACPGQPAPLVRETRPA